ncbi:MAG: hypothetical protein IJI68_11495 [Eggerthellaceae bacterium]|nr:hypothetical protein [Eggerthellaceae bacterium]
MSKRVYISADYSPSDGDRDVVDVLHSWGKDDKHKVDYVDTAEVISGSVVNDPDCRPCDLKKEFNRQINASSAVIFIIGDKTASRVAGSTCRRNSTGAYCNCTPYKQNANGKSICKWPLTSDPDPDGDLGNINTFSYIEHEFRQAQRRGKKIIVVYNSLNRQIGWLPSYMKGCGDCAEPFWVRDALGNRVGNYAFVKRVLGYE